MVDNKIEVQVSSNKLSLNRTFRTVRIPLFFLAGAGIAAGIVGGLGLCLVGSYGSVFLRQARDAYVVHRIADERDHLRAKTDRMEREMAMLRREKTNVSDFETTVNQRLNELQTVVESSTALGLFKREKREDRKEERWKSEKTSDRVIEPKDLTSPKQDSALAALLDSPQLKGLRNQKEAFLPRKPEFDDLRARNRGLGGAEVECKRDTKGKIICASTVSKEDFSYEAKHLNAESKPGSVASLHYQPASLNTDRPQLKLNSAPTDNQFSQSQILLLERLDQATAVMKSLPIGVPVRGELTSGFGYRVSPFSHRSSFHEGIDIALKRGTRIRVPGDGVVVKSEYDGAYGWVVDIAHAGKISTRYAHLTRAIVRSGQRVRRGQVIALSGSTGRSTGPHLHYEVRVNGLAKNPAKYITLATKLNRFVS